MKKYVNLFVFVFMIGACLSQGRAQTKSAVSYKNPVVDIAMPDPTVIKAADGYFYVYATESTRNVPIMRSKDLVEWTYCNTAFTIKLVPGLNLKLESGHLTLIILTVNMCFIMQCRCGEENKRAELG